MLLEQNTRFSNAEDTQRKSKSLRNHVSAQNHGSILQDYLLSLSLPVFEIALLHMSEIVCILSYGAWVAESDKDNIEVYRINKSGNPLSCSCFL